MIAFTHQSQNGKSSWSTFFPESQENLAQSNKNFLQETGDCKGTRASHSSDGDQQAKQPTTTLAWASHFQKCTATSKPPTKQAQAQASTSTSKHKQARERSEQQFVPPPPPQQPLSLPGVAPESVMQQQEQGEFSEWLHALRSQQQTTAASAASHMSDSSSWADTDSESDSDSEAHAAHFTFGDHKNNTHKSSKMVPSYERTAPMLIPQASRPRRRSYYMDEFEDSLPSHNNNQHTSSSPLQVSSSYYGESVEDEDDPALYQNLAYFRSQNKTSSSHHKQQQYSVRSRSPSPVSSTASDTDSDDIFDMEL